MKNVFELLVISALLWSCGKQEVEPCALTEVEVYCELSKGVMVGSDNIANLNVFAYKDGNLCAQAYTKSPTLKLELLCDHTYSIYAIANLGKVDAPASESSLPALRCNFIQSDRGSPVPMVSKTRTNILVRDGETVGVEVERLMSICRLKINKQFRKYDFVFKGARLMQVPVDVCPFAEESAASKTASGDYVSSGDIVNLNNGGSADFWMLENCQGVLLPGNTYQWMKAPESIRDKQNLCTYMEVDGRIVKNGTSAKVTYRMYLGRDNCTDFNVSRNTLNELILTLTDDGISQDSWQVKYYGL